MKKISERVLHEGKWLILKEDLYLTETGTEVRWEYIERRNVRSTVSVVATLRPSGRLVLIKQYRPAVGRFVIGFPAGMVPDGRDPASHGLEELREETGYIGTIVRVSPPVKGAIGLTNDDVYIVTADCDEADPRNQAPVQHLEPEEEIDVLIGTPEELKSRILAEAAEGTCLSSGVWLALEI